MLNHDAWNACTQNYSFLSKNRLGKLILVGMLGISKPQLIYITSYCFFYSVFRKSGLAKAGLYGLTVGSAPAVNHYCGSQ